MKRLLWLVLLVAACSKPVALPSGDNGQKGAWVQIIDSSPEAEGLEIKAANAGRMDVAFGAGGAERVMISDLQSDDGTVSVVPMHVKAGERIAARSTRTVAVEIRPLRTIWEVQAAMDRLQKVP